MVNRTQFLREISVRGLNQTEEAIALLWYYRQTQTFEERSASELSADFRDEGYTAPNVTRLNNALRRSRKTIAGKRNGTFQINSRYLNELEADFGTILDTVVTETPPGLILPTEFGSGQRHLEQLVKEINGSYERGYYDACAVLLRRVLESLIISIFIRKRQSDFIKINGMFLGLEILIERILNLDGLEFSRDTRRIMIKIKEVGDVAAHSRTYLTTPQDIDDIKHGARRVLDELWQAFNGN